MLGKAETGGVGRRGDKGGDMGALGIWGGLAEQKSGLLGADVA